MCLIIWTCPLSQSGVSTIFHLWNRKLQFHGPILIRSRAVHDARRSFNSGTFWVRSLTRRSFSKFSNLQSFYQKSSALSVVFSIVKIRCLDLGVLFGVGITCILMNSIVILRRCRKLRNKIRPLWTLSRQLALKKILI